MPTTVSPVAADVLTYTAACRVCGVDLHRIAVNDDEWGWADPSGSTFGDNFPSDPYAEMDRLIAAGNIGRYHLLKVRVETGGAFHQHHGLAGPHSRSDQPDHCGQPAYLAPTGWRCRATDCKAPLEGI